MNFLFRLGQKFKFLFRPNFDFWTKIGSKINFYFRLENYFSGPKWNLFFGPKIGLKNDFPQWSPTFLIDFEDQNRSKMNQFWMLLEAQKELEIDDFRMFLRF